MCICTKNGNGIFSAECRQSGILVQGCYLNAWISKVAALLLYKKCNIGNHTVRIKLCQEMLIMPCLAKTLVQNPLFFAII